MKRFDQLTPAGKATIVSLYSRARGYQAILPNNIPNPETPGQFVLRKLNENVVQVALQQRASDQEQAARTAALDDNDIQ